MDWRIYHDSAFALKWREPQRFKWLRGLAELRERGVALFPIKVLALSSRVAPQQIIELLRSKGVEVAEDV